MDDDRSQILRSPYIRDLHYLREIFTSSVWSFGGGPSNYYRPMMTLGYLVCHQLFGLNPAGFHLVNLLLNAGVIYLLFQVTGRVFQSRVVAFTAAAVFAFHPVHTEPVAWIAAVPDLELTFFYLLTFWFFLDLERPAGNGSPGRYLAMTGSFALALLSKEQAVTLPLLATVYEHFHRADRVQTTLTQKVARCGPLWLLLFLYFPLRAYFLGGFAPQSRLQDLTLYQTLLSSLALIGQYLGKLLWPVHLVAFYVFRKSESLLDERVLFGMLGCFGAVAMFLILWTRARPACFGIVWVFVTLAPVLNPHWLVTNVFAERYLYLPSVGFCWLIATGFVHLYHRFANSPRDPVPRAVVYAALGMVAVLCTIRIVSRNRDWRNEIAFDTRTLADAPELPAVNELRLSLEAAYARQGDLDAAERELRLMLASEPENIRVLSDLGAVLMRQTRPDEAKQLFLRVIAIDPSYANAHANLGDIYMHAGMIEQAEAELRTATRLKPAYAAAYAYANLGRIYSRKGDRAQAEGFYKSALSVNSLNSEALFGLGQLYGEGGQTAEAIHEYKAGLEGDPRNAAAHAALRRLTERSTR